MMVTRAAPGAGVSAAGRCRSPSWGPVLGMAACDAAGVPLSYLLNAHAPDLGYAATLGTTLAVLACLAAVVVLGTWPLVHDTMFYGFAAMSFSCVVNLLLALEVDGLLEGFMTLYLAHCEPYLRSSWGAVACYSDFIIFLPCYVVMAYRASNGQSYRTLGLHYAGGMLNAMVVMLVGACLSRSGPTLVTMLLLAPYVVLPLGVAARCLRERGGAPAAPRQPGWADAVLAVMLVKAALVALVRGLASLQSDQSVPGWYRDHVEPALKQTAPAPFAAVQGLVSLFYFLPTYLLVAGGLYGNPGEPWLRDAATLLAGASLQAGVTQLGMSLRGAHSAPVAFWTAGLLTSLVPQLVVLRLCGAAAEPTPADGPEKTPAARHKARRKRTKQE